MSVLLYLGLEPHWQTPAVSRPAESSCSAAHIPKQWLRRTKKTYWMSFWH